MNAREIYRLVVNQYGESYQVDKAIEEMGELIQALIKYRQHGTNKDNVAEEMADVEIILSELKLIFSNRESVKEWKKYKLERLESNVKKDRLNEEKFQTEFF